MKIFSMNEYDLMAAETLEEAKEAYLKDCCCTFDDPYPYELSDKDMDTLLISSVEDSEVRTFREQLNHMIALGEKFPTFFTTWEVEDDYSESEN